MVDALDYLVAMKRGGLGARLVWMGQEPKLAWRVARERYELGWDPLEDAEVLPWRWQLGRKRFSRVLVPYTTFRRVSMWIRAEETCVLPSQWMRRDAGRPFGWPLTRGRVRYLLDPDRHDYTLSGRMEYRKKVLLDELRRPERTERAVLVNCESSHKRHAPGALLRAAGPDWEPRQIRVLCSGKSARAYREAGMEVLEPPVENLFARYTHYLYLPARGGYDENPRLLLESAWLGKEILLPDTSPSSIGDRERLLKMCAAPGDWKLGPNDPLLEMFRQPVAD